MEEKLYYTIKDLRERYGVGESKAKKIMREIHSLSPIPGGKLGKGKCLPAELHRWEQCDEGQRECTNAGLCG